MIDFGTVQPGTTLYIPFATYDSNDPSASVTISGLATTDIEVYKDGSTTQRASDSGYALLDTDGIDFDTITGIHGISIDLSDNTTAGFWAAGSQYTVVISSITVDAATINFIAATFRIGYPQAILNTTIATLSTQTSFTLTAGPAEDDALNGRQVIIHDVASGVQVGHAVISDYTGSTKTVTLAAATTFTIAATDNISVLGLAPLQPTTAGNTLDVTSTGAAGIDWANVENQSTSVDLSATSINLCDTITTYTGNTVQTGDAFARLGAPAGASVSADIATVDSNVDAVLVDTAEIGAAGAGLTAIPWNAAWDAEVQSEVNDGLVALGLDHLVSAAVIGTDVTDNSIIAQLVSKSATADWDSYDNTTDSVEAIRDRGDAAWTTGAGGTPPQLMQNTTIATLASQTSFTLTAGSTDDDAYNGAIAVVTDSATSTQKAYGTISDYTGSTKTVTLSADPGVFTMAVGDTIDIMAPLGSAGSAPTAAQVADAVWDEVTAGHTTAGTFGEQVKTDIDAILVDTNLIDHSGPYGCGVYFDADAANTNTTVGTDGIPSNPVSTVAAAKTLAAAIGCNRIYVQGACLMPLTGETLTDYEIVGLGGTSANTVNLGTAASPGALSNVIIRNVIIYGEHNTTTGRLQLMNCFITDAPAAEVTVLRCWARGCGFGGDFEVSANDDIIFDQCLSAVAGTGYPMLTANGATGTIQLRHYSGGIGIQDLSASHNVSIETDGQVVFESGCNVNATVAMRGNMTITDNTAGMNNLSREAVTNRTDWIGGAYALNTTATGNVGIDWANVENPTTSVGLTGTTIAWSAAWDAEVESEVTDAIAAAGLDHLVARHGTAQAGTVNSITLDASASAVDDFYNGQAIYIHGGTGAGQVGIIVDYTGSTKVASVRPVWPIATPDATSTFAIFSLGTTNVGAISLDGAAADNLEADYDGSGYTKSNSTIGTAEDLGATARTRVNTEVLDVLNTDTFAEVSGVPAATSTLADKLNWVFTVHRNKLTQTATTQLVRNDADSATLGTSTVSDDGTTFTRGEYT